MIQLPYPQILEKIKAQSQFTEEQINEKVNAKMQHLNGLVSKEGAAHIVANELGIKLIISASGLMKISSILPGMRQVETVGKVVAVYDVREFQKENTSGKVGSCVIADDTGSIRITCWHNQADHIKELKVDDIVRVVDAYVRDNNGQKELHLNDKSRFIINPPNITIDNISASQKQSQRKRINELAEFQNNIELFGTIVQVFEPRYYEICPECNKRARAGENGFECDTHQNVSPNYSYVMSVTLDDGSETIRIVCFRDQAERLTSKSADEFLQFKDDIASFEEIKNNLLGTQILVTGRVQKNAMFDRLEFLARNINLTPDLDEEIIKLDKELAVVN